MSNRLDAFVTGYARRMKLSRGIAQPLLGGILIVGGSDSVRNPAPTALVAESVVPKLLRPLGLSTETADVIRANGIVQVAAASALALGFLPRAAAAILVGSLVPETLAGHRFWNEPNEVARAEQQLQFLKNLAVIAGLVLVIGEPRVGREAD
jgi:putative oxidoreductase